MANASIGGLASGLDTATIISQLMQLEALPQTKLKSRVTTEQGVVSALQSLNTKLASLATKSAELTTATAWSRLKTTSTSEAVTVTAANTATPTSLSLKVDQTALTHQVGFTAGVALTDTAALAGASLSLTPEGGTAVSVQSADGSLKGLIDAVNAQTTETGVRAVAVKSADGYRLMLEATESGAAGRFTATFDGGSTPLGAQSTQVGRDATVSLGALQVTSSSNTFTDLLPGVTVTVTPGSDGTTSQISVERDGTARADSVKALVDQVNGLLGDISTQTAYNATTKTAGKLANDSAVRGVANQLREALYPNDGTSMAQFGLEVDRNGKLTFDAKKFNAAYAADPDAVTAAFTGAGGFADRVQQVADAASDKYDGRITKAIESRNAGIERLNDSITAWDTRLEMRRKTLERTYTALETALSRMNSQGTWLAGQISGLPSYND